MIGAKNMTKQLRLKSCLHRLFTKERDPKTEEHVFFFFQNFMKLKTKRDSKLLYISTINYSRSIADVI